MRIHSGSRVLITARRLPTQCMREREGKRRERGIEREEERGREGHGEREREARKERKREERERERLGEKTPFLMS